MTAFYNENDAYPAAWLSNLIAAGHIAPGIVSAADIRSLTPADVATATQAHFFAGIGIWSHALRLAGWPDDLPVWTGSCPCQPFSSAGKRKGLDDDRHLWPAWFRLIDAVRPPIIFGEQVASKAGLDWFDVVSSDLERASYVVAPFDFGAASVGAPHIRQRLYFMAYASGIRAGRNLWSSRATHGAQGAQAVSVGQSFSDGLGNASSARRQGRESKRRNDGAQCEAAKRASFWSDVEWLPCHDGKARPIKPGIEPLAYGHPNRVARLRAIGNAIVAPQAALFIETVMECLCLG